MNTRHKRLRSILTGLMLSMLTAQDPFVIDTSLSNSLPQSIANSIEIADVDNDGGCDDNDGVQLPHVLPAFFNKIGFFVG